MYIKDIIRQACIDDVCKHFDKNLTKTFAKKIFIKGFYKTPENLLLLSTRDYVEHFERKPPSFDLQGKPQVFNKNGNDLIFVFINIPSIKFG